MAIVKMITHHNDSFNLIDYITNGAKTNFMEYVYAYNCDPELASLDFNITEAAAVARFGERNQGGGKPISAYHIVQSFAYDDDVTPEESLEIGIKLADAYLGGKYEYVVATHIDKGHIHNHIAINARSFIDLKKLQTPPTTHERLCEISDKLCEEYGLSIIDNPYRGRNAYSTKEYYAKKNGRSFKEELRVTIDEAITHAGSFEEFKETLGELGIDIKEGKSAKNDYISFKHPDKDRYTGGRSLGEAYTKENIISRIETGRIVEPDTTLLTVSFHKKLVVKETDVSYICRIPYTTDTVEFKKKEITKKGKGNNIFVAQIKENKVYRVKDKDGKVKGQLKGLDFLNHYEDLNGYKDKLSEKLQTQEPETFPQKLVKVTKKQRRKNIQELSDALLCIRSEGIASASGFREKTMELNRQTEDVKKKLDTAIRAKEAYIAAVGSLSVIKEHGALYSEYSSCKGLKKKSFLKKHEKEIMLYEHATKKLENMGASPTLDVDMVQEAITKAEEQEKSLRQDIESLEQRKERIIQARKIVENISTPQETSIEKQQERRKDGIEI